jgi:hypothetical protein
VNKTDSVTLRQYYASFKGASGVMAGLFSSAPLLSKLIPEAHSGYGFPPLGSAEGAARVGTVVLALATTYFAFFFKDRSAQSCR